MKSTGDGALTRSRNGRATGAEVVGPGEAQTFEGEIWMNRGDFRHVVGNQFGVAAGGDHGKAADFQFALECND